MEILDKSVGGLFAPVGLSFFNEGPIVLIGWVCESWSRKSPILRVEVGKRVIEWQLDSLEESSNRPCSGTIFEKTFSVGKGLKSIKVSLVDGEQSQSYVIGKFMLWQKDRVRVEVEDPSTRERSTYERWLEEDQLKLRDVNDLEFSEIAFPVGITWIVEVYSESGLLHTLDQLFMKSGLSSIFLVDRCGLFSGNLGKKKLKAYRTHPAISLVGQDLVPAFGKIIAGTWLGFLRSGDEIDESLVRDFYRYLGAHPQTKLFYTDHDTIGENGAYENPVIKPAWNRDLLTSNSYIGHAFLVSKETCLDALSSDPYAGDAYWAMQLAVVRNCTRTEVGRLCGVYFHLTKPRPEDDVFRLKHVIGYHYETKSDEVKLTVAAGGRGWHASYQIPTQEGFMPKVTLLIPTRDGVEVLAKGIDSILEKTNYPNFEILVLDNESKEPETLEYFDTIRKKGCRILPCPGVFNYSQINNRGSMNAEGEILAFLNNDLEVIDGNWLREMVGQVCREDVGAVGAKLLYPDGRIQHTGVLLGVGHVAAHAYRLFEDDSESGPIHAHVVQNFSAVTAACLVVRKRVFHEVGGFDDVDLAITNNDVDLCIKIREAGYRNVYTPRAVLFHHESATRGPEDTPEKKVRYKKEVDVMWKRWQPILLNDPAYNRLLTRYREDYSLASATELETYKPGIIF